MAGLEWLIWPSCFVTGALFIYGILNYAESRRMVRDRFRKPAVAVMPLLHRTDGGLKKRFLEWVSGFAKYGMRDKEESSKLRWTLVQAGYRHPKSTAVFYGIRFLLPFVLSLPYLLATVINGMVAADDLTVCLVLAGAGFYLPTFMLKYMVRRRQDRLDKALPDVLDLLIVCMESGLSLQSTLNRVSDEVRNISKEMHEELHLTNAELRTGISRELALRNMGERTGAEAVKSLVGIMVQSEKMGTSVATALRVHASFLRTHRAQMAEEKAGKLPVKIMFPMLLFIFPAVFLIVLGPAAINIVRGFIKANF